MHSMALFQPRFSQRNATAVSAVQKPRDNNTPDTATISDGAGVHSALPLFFFVERYTDSYIAEMKAFVEYALGQLYGEDE